MHTVLAAVFSAAQRDHHTLQSPCDSQFEVFDVHKVRSPLWFRTWAELHTTCTCIYMTYDRHPSHPRGGKEGLGDRLGWKCTLCGMFLIDWLASIMYVLKEFQFVVY